MVELSGGVDLDRRLSELAKGLRKAASVRVGFLEGSTYPDGTSVALVAAINEWGQTRIHPNQPPRPFFRRMIKEKSPEWPQAIAGLLVANDYDAEKVLALTGAAIAGQLQQSIVDFVDPPLSPVTVALKGHDKPLNDSGVMLKSVSYEVEGDQ